LEQLKKLAAKLSVEKNVKFLGLVDKPTLAKIFNASEAFVIASTSEVQSMTILQAAACGLPIIGVNSRGVADCVRDNGFLFQTNNHQELADKAVLLLSDEKLMNKFGQNSVISAKNFSPSRIAAEWERVYNQVIKPSKKYEN